MTKTVEVTPTIRYQDLFEERTDARKGEPSELVQKREEALSRFLEQGFPHNKLEDWKKTDVRRLARTQYQLAAAPSNETIDKARLALAALTRKEAALRMVFIDGFHVPQLSEAPARPGVQAMSLAQAVREESATVAQIAPGDEEDPASTGDRPEWALAQMNLALFTDGIHLKVAQDTTLEEPVHVIHLATGAQGPILAVPRHQVDLGPNADVTLMETYAGLDLGPVFTNTVLEADLAEGARLHHYKEQREPLGADHIGLIAVRQAKDAKYKDLSFSLGAGLSRYDIHVALVGEGAHVDLNGVFLGRKEQHVDHRTTIVHAVPETTSRQLYKGIMDDSAHGVFTGKVVVSKGAQHTDADQQNKNLILSRKGLVDSTPQLEIYADDVKCAHGSAIGQIDKNQVFYLRTRGVPEERARLILTQAFAHEPLQLVAEPALRERFTGLVTDWFVAGNPAAVRDAPLGEEDPRPPEERDPLRLPVSKETGVPKR